MKYQDGYDVIVVGGGHAGTEACLASARSGAKTLLLTQNIETIGVLSCNPSIGGMGKSHLVKEVDALGGLMGIAADASAIQLRVLNSRKGPAVRATRAQIDRNVYRVYVRSALEEQENLDVFQQEVISLCFDKGRLVGVKTHLGIEVKARSVILTTGTFLNGLAHIGLSNYQSGRAGDSPSCELAAQIKSLDLPVGRLKTGTPPRLNGVTIDYSKMIEQRSDEPLPKFSLFGSHSRLEQVSCWITRTNLSTHQVILNNLKESPLYSGVIESKGPRYCPSIEDKIHRFEGIDSHQIFLEPEGLKTHEVYPQGISTSLPFHAQVDLVKTIQGLENVHITRPGYAIEYDYLDPIALKSNLMSKKLTGLFMAGQINGTTGYEEAAAQGLIAGFNAASFALDREFWSPNRSEAYLGVMIDDLITKGVSEPYRMFTSRSEFRLALREDNADLRLTEKGTKLGLVNQDRWVYFEKKRFDIDSESERLKKRYIGPKTKLAVDLEQLTSEKISKPISFYHFLTRASYQDIKRALEGEDWPDLEKSAIEQIEYQARYAGYIDRQALEVEKIQKAESFKIPSDLELDDIHGLSNEVKFILRKYQPETLSQASRLEGMTPASISILHVYLTKFMIQGSIN